MDILLVEDNVAQALTLKNIFEQQKDAPEVHWVPDGYVALNYLLRHPPYEFAHRPDIVLLDLKLPRISGFEVLKQLKENPAVASIPVIILSAALTPLNAMQCQSLGADICLAKPVTVKDCEELARHLMSWTYLQPSPVLASERQ